MNLRRMQVQFSCMETLSSITNITSNKIKCVPFKWDNKNQQLIKLKLNQLRFNLLVMFKGFIKLIFVSYRFLYESDTSLSFNFADKLVHLLVLISYAMCFILPLTVWIWKDLYLNFINHFFRLCHRFNERKPILDLNTIYLF